jgi:hypothetical protein
MIGYAACMAFYEQGDSETIDMPTGFPHLLTTQFLLCDPVKPAETTYTAI